MKLNNKGVTTVEVLVSFVLLAIIVVSLYGTVESYKNKQNIESEKNQIMTYKNLLTKEIQDDLIMKGLIDVSISFKKADASTSFIETTTATFSFKNGYKSNLIVKRRIALEYGTAGVVSDDCSYAGSSGVHDYYSISYGGVGEETEYQLPEIGHGENELGCTVQDLRISNVDINADDDILSINIRFYHPDFSTKYGIDIACPINFFR